MGVVICSFEVTGITPAEASARLAAAKSTLYGITLPGGEEMQIKTLDYRADETDMAE